MRDRLTFAGLSERKSLPPAYETMVNRHGTEHIGTLRDALTFLEARYPAEWRDLYYNDMADPDEGVNPRTVTNYRSVVNPLWVADGLPEDVEKSDPVWYIPTTRYTLLEHHDALEPLAEAIARVGAETVFGTVRTRRDGGEVHLDVFFQGTDIGADGDKLTLGISTGNDYHQNVSLYVDVVAFLSPSGTDGGRVMRYLVDKDTRKHTGTARDDIVTFYEKGARRLDEATERIREVVANAMHHTVPVDEMPISMPTFYQNLGLPDRKPNEVATPAGSRVTRITPEETNPTAWHLYKSGMWAMENHYEPRDTNAFKNNMTAVNTLLFNPSLAERRVLSEIESDLLEAKTDDDHELTDYVADAESAVDDELEAVRTRARTVSEGVAEFENVRERISSLLTDEGTEERVPDDEEPETGTARVEASD